MLDIWRVSEEVGENEQSDLQLWKDSKVADLHGIHVFKSSK